MQRPIFKPIGTPLEELDTPALVVDIAALQRNIEAMHSFFRERTARLRPHVEAHRCPAIAHMQLAAGGTAGGICVTTLGQAEVFAENGFTDIAVSNLVVTAPKVRRLCSLARRARVAVAVDSPDNVKDLSAAATAGDVVIDVLVSIHSRLNSFGVEPGRPAVDLARVVAAAEGLEFTGLTAYEGPLYGRLTEREARGGEQARQTLGWLPSGAGDEEHDQEDVDTSLAKGTVDDVAAESRKWIQVVLDTREMMERAGLEVRTVSVGGTHNYEIAGSTDGVTEVAAGSYALLDERYRPHRPRFQPAARVITTVTSVPEEGVAITDGGGKSIGSDSGAPSVDNVPGARSLSLSAEHGTLALDPASKAVLELGDKVWYTPWDIGTCVNLHDYMFLARDGRLEAVWAIAARGRYR